MGKFIFRRIGGRIVPIKISSEKASKNTELLVRRVKAEARIDGETHRVGTAFVSTRKTGIRANLENVSVRGDAKKQGIGSELYEYAQRLMGRAGKKIIRSDSIEHVAQAKIQARAGKTAFIGGGYPGATNRKLNAKEAQLAVKNLKTSLYPAYVTGSTVIPKKWWRKK